MEIDVIKEKLTESGHFSPDDRIERLSGDASSREYFRLLKKSGKSLIVCAEEPQGQQSKDFNTITALIKSKLKTPEILYYQPNDSLIVLEDVGSQSLKDYYETKGLSQHLKAIEDIHLYQQLPLSTCQERFFDREKISFEFDLAVKYFLGEYLKLTLSEEEQNDLNSIKEFIVQYYENHKEVVCHRDYHSNNIYIKNEELFHIDYQDMRVGPRMYDLVSLVDDCYIDFSDSEKRLLLTSFDKEFQNKFETDYHIVQVQRTFKALGSFTYLNFAKGKNGYLVYVDNNLEKLIKITEQSSILEFNIFSKILKRGRNG